MAQAATLETSAPPPEPGTEARQAHAAALENHRQALERTSKAEAAHRNTIAARQTLLDRASAGEQVNATEMRRAGAAIAESKDAAEVAASITSGAAICAERAHILALREEASFLTANYKAAVRMRVEAAEKIDEMMILLQQVIGNFNATNLTISVLANGAHLHDHGLPEQARTNAVLARMEDGDFPKTGVPYNNILKPVQIAFTEIAWGEKQVLPPFSLAARERSLFGLNAPPPPDPERMAPPLNHIFGVIPKRHGG